jgi:hypothetical protein
VKDVDEVFLYTASEIKETTETSVHLVFSFLFGEVLRCGRSEILARSAAMTLH